MTPLILASTSPRRKKILARLGLPFTMIPSEYEEDMTLDLPPKRLAKTLALGKARAVALKHRGAIIIAADTFIAYKNEVLGKPKSKTDAKKMLAKLSGKSHSILTGLAVIDSGSGKTISRVVETKVYFRKLTPKEIVGYLGTPEPMDKAAAYAMQGLGAIFIKRIEGDYQAALGLPLFTLAEILQNLGMKIF